MNGAGNLWTSFCKEALDWIYPSKCALCGVLDHKSPCEVCISEMELASPNFVAEVEGPLRFRACVYAYSGRSAQAVRRLKYSRCTSLGLFFAHQVGTRVGELAGPDEILVPVPIHRSRRSDRGFNQAEICAAQSELNLVRPELLRRTRATKPQAGLSLEERQRNLDGAFSASPEAAGRDIVLIDDVVTSGHTARECARALLKVGAKSVGIVAFAGNLD